MHQRASAARKSHRSSVRIVSVCTLALSVFYLHCDVSAQDALPPANREVQSHVLNDTKRVSVSTSPKIVYSNADRQSANRTITLANRTLRHSREAFRRGLMSYADYELHLKTALKMKLTAAELLQDRKLIDRSIQKYRQTIDESVNLLKQFHQVGSQGWAGDLQQAKLLATEARQLSAVFEGNRNGVHRLNRLRKQQALALLEIRTRDYRQGLASVSQLNDAVIGTTPPRLNNRFLKSYRIKKKHPSNSNSNLNRHQNRMKRELNAISRLSSASSGIGRSDRLFAQRTKLRRSRVSHSAKASPNRKSQIFDRQNANRQRRFYRTGTASLFDLTRTWLSRQQEIEENRRNRRPIDPSRNLFHRSEFHGLVKRAKAVGDLRGRHAADVSLVKSLKQYSRLSESVFRNQEEALREQEKQKANPDLTGFLRIQFR